LDGSIPLDLTKFCLTFIVVTRYPSPLSGFAREEWDWAQSSISCVIVFGWESAYSFSLLYRHSCTRNHNTFSF